jgi:hypothetical protein
MSEFPRCPGIFRPAKSNEVDRHAARMPMLDSGAAVAQTSLGRRGRSCSRSSPRLSSFTSHVTLFNPNGGDISVGCFYFDADNLPSPGAKPCTDAVVPAHP